MALAITILAEDGAEETRWARHLRSAFGDWADAAQEIDIGLASQGSDPSAYGQVVFVDSQMRELEAALSKLDRAGRAVFLITKESGSRGGDAEWMRLIDEGRADDALVFPFRALEMRSKLRHYRHILDWEEVSRLNATFSDVIARLREDLKLAERLQKKRAPARFPAVKGFKVSSRYLAGMRSGGDHHDLAESKTGNRLSIVLSDSSSYGLSSAVLSALMRVAVRLSQEETRSCEETVRRIYEELAVTLGDKDRLSLFYGVISRKDYCLRYVNLGTSCAFYAQPGQNFRLLPSQGPAISREGFGSTLAPGEFESELPLEPQGRLALISDGFVEALGDSQATLDALNRYRDEDSKDFLNELVYQLKAGFTEPDELPKQDCTAVLLDVDSRVLRKI